MTSEGGPAMVPEGGQTIPDAEAAVALAGFAQKASNVGGSTLESRRTWDQDPAAPPIDNGVAQPLTGPASAPPVPVAYHHQATAQQAATQRQPSVAAPRPAPVPVAAPNYYYHVPHFSHYAHPPPPHYAHPHHPPPPPHAPPPVATPLPAQAPAPAVAVTHPTTTTLNHCPPHTSTHGPASHAAPPPPATRQSYAESPIQTQPQLQPQPKLQQQPVVAEPPSAILMSMSTIGFGVAPSGSVDATEAAIRAVKDSMERSAIRLPTTEALRSQLTIKVKIGVPPKATGAPMYVDTSRLSLFLPPSVPLVPVEIVVGGLLIEHANADGPSLGESSPSPQICTAVACVTLQQQAQSTATEAKAPTPVSQQQQQPPVTKPAPVVPNHPIGRPTEPTTQPAPTANPAGTSPWGQMHATPTPPPQHHRSVSQPLPTAYHHPHQIPATAAASHNQQQQQQQPPPQQGHVHRSNSMEVLAQISGEMRSLASTAAPQQGNARPLSVPMTEGPNGDDGSYSFKKLSPGMTPKNNKRLFVRHEYKDYAREKPLPEEMFLVNSDSHTPNANFPLKLFETLTQIEKDGLSHIVGWMPHGRSFKIHQQQEFVDVVLPRYFVMTKKSSFLRQLNLYGWTRISVGPDSGSYYHEKFLKGLKFLCRRMSRQKVNGNGIRAAGNPEQEPQLNNYPPCPPSSVDYASEEETGQQGLAPLAPNGPMEANAPETSPVTLQRTSSLGSQVDASGQNNSFPFKLHRLLDTIEVDGKHKDIISWQPHGRSFLVHDVDRFVGELMNGKVFNQTKYSSFQRQLHMYDLRRITFGRDKGAYYHENFQRGRPDLCASMVRTRVNGKGCRRPGDPDNEPDFYEMEYAPRLGPGGEIIEVPRGSQDEDNEEESDMQIDGGENTNTPAVAV